jgi:PIN domain nuclease of toxin-antitoxin system
MSGLLLDTHALLWYGQAEPDMSPGLLALMRGAGSTCFISRASLWEVTIKHSLGKLAMPDGLAKWLADVWGQFPLLEITDAHLLQLSQLPAVKDHRDPFDRLLIAQALAEDLMLISRDGKFGAYAGLQVRWE